MIEEDTHYATKSQLIRYIGECTDTKIEDMTGEKVLSYLFDHTDGWYGQYRIVNTDYHVDERIYHRVNRLWAYPFTLLCSPFRYLAYGHVGWSKSTKFGNWILNCCGDR